MRSHAGRLAVLVGGIAFSISAQGLAQDASEANAGAPSSSPSTISVPEGEALVLELQDPLNTRTTRKGDTVNLTVTTDVFAGGQIVIPRGSTVRATVTKAKRPGRVFGKALIRLQFDQLTLQDGTSYPITTQLSPSGWWEPTGDMKSQGEGSKTRDLKRIGSGAAQGALIGAVFGGGRGATRGAAAGAAAGTAAVMLERGPELDLPPGMMFEVQLTKPLTLPLDYGREEASETADLLPAETPSEPTADGAKGKTEIAARTTTGNPEAAPQPTPSPSAPPALPRVSDEEIKGAYKLEVKVNLVLVETTVRDQRGQIVDNLQREDFSLAEDGVKQEINHFSRDELPLAVAIVVDRSGSVEPLIEKLRDAALETLSLLKPEDQVALFAFDSKCDRLEYLTQDRERIAQAIARIRPGGGTNITDAVFAAALYLGRAAPSRRHAIVLVSDNQETVRGFASASDVVRMGLETETTVYSIYISPQGFSRRLLVPDLIPGANVVNKMTRETGGEVFQAYDGSSIKTAMGAVINRLKKRYTLGYTSTNANQDGKFREISVQLRKDSDASIKNYRTFARRGYYAPLARTASTDSAKKP